MDLSERQELNNGFGETLARAFELVLTPAIFGGMGWWLDGRFGTRPVIALVLFVLVFVYEVWKMLSGYTRAMEVQERKMLAKVRGRTGAERAGLP